MKYNDCYNKATIIMERVVQLKSLKDTFIPEVFKERTWTKLLNPVGVVYSEIINVFFSNAAVDRYCIECWVRHKEFVITREIIQDFLEICPSSQPISVQYEDKLGSIEEMLQILGGYIEEVIYEHITIFTRDEDFGLCDDSQLVPIHQPDYIVNSKDNVFVRSLHPQGN